MSTTKAHQFVSGWNGDCQHCGEMEMYHMTKTAHTPGPWKVGYRDEASNELVITDDDRDEGHIDKMIPVCRVIPQPHYRDTQGVNAEFIVRACNSHDVMLGALKATNGWLEVLIEDSMISESNKPSKRSPNMQTKAQDNLLAALEKAKEVLEVNAVIYPTSKAACLEAVDMINTALDKVWTRKELEKARQEAKQLANRLNWK